jgi:hypothetical protein
MFCKWTLVLAVPAVWVAAALPAQLAVPEGTTIKLILLRQKSVQQELNLTADEVKMVMEFTNKQYEAARKALDLPREERRQKFQALRKENRKFLTDNLKPEQLKRLEQITMQLTALTQLTRPEIAKALQLTEEQSQKFKEMQVEARKKLGELIDSKDNKTRKEELAKLREEARKKIMALLTAEQRAKVKEMVGKPFEGELVFEMPEDKSEK